jgi:hypothetical protein
MDQNDPEIRKQRTQFIKTFADLAEATANLNGIAKKQVELMNEQIKVMNGLIDTMMMPKDGMRDVLDEVLGELQGLRDDLRVVAKAGGFGQALAALMGRRPKGG